MGRLGLKLITGPANAGKLRRLLSTYVEALPAELDANARATIRQLQSDSAIVTATAARAGDATLVLDVSVRNLTGHKLPTGYPARRSWLREAISFRPRRPIGRRPGLVQMVDFAGIGAEKLGDLSSAVEQVVGEPISLLGSLFGFHDTAPR